ncbi:MAG: 30S ribosomal protein S2 [Pelagibacterales bacterium]|nr:30S ribosomal protein S2 [Pelagibacterales bacterium]|tara:strand:+ start:4381 stop:5211 length:831 start_codon:yes stop_codon:yes gene_type:complete
MRQLLDAGIHFGHQSHRWNPKMKPYIFGTRNGIHIIDLQQTVPLLHNALVFLHEIANNSGKILFVGTKRQAQQPIQDAAIKNNQFFVTHRWPGGMLTNWKTISQSIKQLDELDAKLDEKNDFVKMLTKKERLNLQRKQGKLNLSLGGIRNMNGVPDAMIIFDTNKEKNALEEAKVLNIPIVAVIDSNSNPDGIDFPIPGNDDATRALKTFCDLISETINIKVISNMTKKNEDIGETDILTEDLQSLETTSHNQSEDLVSKRMEDKNEILSSTEKSN